MERGREILKERKVEQEERRKRHIERNIDINIRARKSWNTKYLY